MRLESPEFKRCCLCLPLRRGLIGWGYIKLVLDVLATLYFGFNSFFILLFNRTLVVVVTIVVIISLLLFDIGFTILLIVAGHMKSAMLLQTSFIYSVVWLILVLALGLCATAGSLPYNIVDEWTSGNYGQVLSTLLTSTVLLFSMTFVNMYLTLLIRSEAKKLRNHSLKVQFVNNCSVAEDKAASVCAVVENDAY